MFYSGWRKETSQGRDQRWRRILASVHSELYFEGRIVTWREGKELRKTATVGD